ncbi:Ras- protein RABE1e [Bulinus truncatus]|nr:Ras- protein RABE1e [Bulinus truncatus]
MRDREENSYPESEDEICLAGRQAVCRLQSCQVLGPDSFTELEEKPPEVLALLFIELLSGEYGVGKTSCFLRLRDEQFYDEKMTTIGIDISSKVLKVDGKEIKLTLIDTAGTERFNSLTNAFFRNSQAVLFVYSVADAKTLTGLKRWYEDVCEYAPKALRYLVGNKTDLESGLSKNMVELHARRYGCECVFYVSAKTGQGFLSLLDTVCKNLLYEQLQYKKSNSIENQSLDINKENVKKKSSCCS